MVRESGNNPLIDMYTRMKLLSGLRRPMRGLLVCPRVTEAKHLGRLKRASSIRYPGTKIFRNNPRTRNCRACVVEVQNTQKIETPTSAYPPFPTSDTKTNLRALNSFCRRAHSSLSPFSFSSISIVWAALLTDSYRNNVSHPIFLPHVKETHNKNTASKN